MNCLLRFRGLLAVTFTGLLGIIAPGQAATFWVSNTNDSGAGSLRQAITDANSAFAAEPKTNAILFRIGRGAATIQPLTPLPVITGHVIINGATQPGFSSAPLVEISGAALDNAVGLEFRVPNNPALSSVVKDLIINRFRSGEGTGIRIGGQSARVRVLTATSAPQGMGAVEPVMLVE